MKMEKHSSKGPDVLKLVHPGGLVETHKRPITASDVMRKNPRHCVTRPDVFKYPWIVVRPDAVLKPGNVFFVVPNHTMFSLLKKNKPGSPEEAAAAGSGSASASPFPEKGLLRSREKKPAAFSFWDDHHKDHKGGIKARFGFGKKETSASSPRDDKKGSRPFEYPWRGRDAKGGMKGPSGFNEEDCFSESSGKRSQNEKMAGKFQFWGDQEGKGRGIRGRFSFGRRGSSSEAESPKETALLHRVLRQQSPEMATGRTKVDCKFEDDGQEFIFPKGLIGCRNNQYFDAETDKTSIVKSYHEAKSLQLFRRPFPGDDWVKGNDEMSPHHSSFRRRHRFEFQSDESPGSLYHQQRPLFSLSIPPREAESGWRFRTAERRLGSSSGQEADQIPLKSCLKQDSLSRGVRVKFSLPGEDEEKLRVEVFEFEPSYSPPYSP